MGIALQAFPSAANTFIFVSILKYGTTFDFSAGGSEGNR